MNHSEAMSPAACASETYADLWTAKYMYPAFQHGAVSSSLIPTRGIQLPDEQGSRERAS